MKTKDNSKVLLAVILIPTLCIGLVCGVFGLVAVYNKWIKPTPGGQVFEQATLPAQKTARTPASGLTTPAALSTFTPVSQEAFETLKTLGDANTPSSDLRDLAERLKGIKNIPETIPDLNAPYKVGAKKTFWASNVDTNANFQINATLRYETYHSYFWMQDGVTFNPQALKRLGDTFENKIYTTDREFFGSEPTPGFDNDPHLYIVYAKGLGNHLAGYFSEFDAVSPLAHPYANGHESFFFNADNVDVGSEEAYSTLAHEFQHMIHAYRDRNEESWLNEGFSVLAEFLNGYSVGGFDQLYASNPDNQLTDWPNDPNSTDVHYGESFMFLDYFLGRFGEKTTKAVVAETRNGLTSIDHVLSTLGITDPKTQRPISADDVFADWTIATLLDNPAVGDGRFVYANDPQAPKADVTETADSCPMDWQDRTVHQYGVNYIRISCSGDFTLKFDGAKEVGVLQENPHSGNYAFWSNKGDLSDMTLSRNFDFIKASGPLEIDYWTWYDLEKDYDFTYLEASLDGKSWQIIKTPTCTTKNISGNSYGCGENGTSNGWIEEKVDLSQFAGKQVQLRFEYVTDPAVNGEGFLLDDVAVPALNYLTDFEKDSGGWEPAGFVRIQNRLPQTFRVSLIKEGGQTQVVPVTLDADQKFNLPLSLGGDTTSAILVVSGTTRFTRQEAQYRFEIVK